MRATLGTRTVAGLVTILLALLSASLWSVAGAPTVSAATGGCGADMGTRQVVVLVHGFNSDATTWTKTKPAMLAAVSGADPGNVYVRLFDYGTKSTQWVTDPVIGPALASFVRCLAQASSAAGGSGKVILVGHSMGGLAIRCAMDAGCSPNPVGKDQVGLVVTIGTPNTGSQLRPSPAADATARTAGEALLALCDIAQFMNGDEWLTQACQYARALGASPAGEAFTIGSHEIDELAPYPLHIPVRAIAGAITLQADIGLWKYPVAMGDIVVGVDSQLLLHTDDRLGGTRTVDCGTVDMLGGAIDILVGLRCWHITETAYAPIQNEVRQAIKDYLRANAVPDTPLPTAVAITTTSIGDIKLGTPADQAERRLRALLGRPDRALDGGCDLTTPREHARILSWGPLTISLSDRAPGSGNALVVKALKSWAVGLGRSRTELALPHGIKIGMSSVEVRTRATITRTETDLSGDVALTDRDGVAYDFDAAKEPTTLRSISYQVANCE